MAIGYGIEGGELYKDSGLYDDIMYALDYMNENNYNIREKKPFTGFDNRYHWDIGCPQFLVKILCILSDELSQEQIDKY